MDNKCRHEDHIDPDPLSFFYQTTVGATSSATSTGTEASVAIDKHHLSASSNSPWGAFRATISYHTR